MMAAAILLSCLSFALLGGWLSRMCGGAPPKLRYGLDQWIYALPYLFLSIPSVLFIASLFQKDEMSDSRFNGWLTLCGFPFFGAFLGKRTGHGGGMDLGTSEKEPGDGRDQEALEFLIISLHGKIPQYWYDALLLAITGVATTLITGIMICFIDLFSGLLIIVSGLLKAPAYMIGALIYPERRGPGIPYLNEATAIGEFLTGFFGYGAIAIAAWHILG